jgi:fucose 4-O-acetylase-like acetyltransferase
MSSDERVEAGADAPPHPREPVAVPVGPPVRPPARLAWIDATRGFSVAAVVLFHVVLWTYGVAGMRVAHVGDAVWSPINSVLGSVRMPVLLAVSGLVLARRIRTTHLRDGVLARAAGNYYLYVVWLVMYAVFYLVVREPTLAHRVQSPLDVVRQLVVPGTTLWYLFAIAVYSVVLTAVRRLPAVLVLVVLTVLATVVHAGTYPDQLWYKVPELFIFYAAGVYAAAPLRRLAEHSTVPRALLAAVVAVAVTGLGRFVPDALSSGVFVARGLAFAVLAVLSVAVLTRWSPIERLGVALGRQTLGVYVLHPLWIALLVVALVRGPGRDVFAAMLTNPLAAVAYPLVATAAVIAVSLPARRLAERVRLGWLFALPPAWAARLTDTPAPASPREPAAPARLSVAPGGSTSPAQPQEGTPS